MERLYQTDQTAKNAVVYKLEDTGDLVTAANRSVNSIETALKTSAESWLRLRLLRWLELMLILR